MDSQLLQKTIDINQTFKEEGMILTVCKENFPHLTPIKIQFSKVLNKFVCSVKKDEIFFKQIIETPKGGFCIGDLYNTPKIELFGTFKILDKSQQNSEVLLETLTPQIQIIFKNDTIERFLIVLDVQKIKLNFTGLMELIDL